MRLINSVFRKTVSNKAPVPLAPKRERFSVFGHKHDTGTKAYVNAYGAVGVVFAIVNRTSTAVSQPDWHLYRKSYDNRVVYEGQEQRTEVTRHAALDLLNKPNKFMTRQELFEISQQHLDLTGEAWWVVTRSGVGGIPLEIWPVRPDKMRPVPDPVNYIAGYIYTDPDGNEIPLTTNEVIFIRMPNPVDMYRGMGPVQAVLTEVDSTRYSSEWNRNFFINGAEPGGIIQVDRRLEDDEFDEMTMRWEEQHKGIANAHRVAIIEQGQYVERKFSQRDMQFVELNQLSREVIREAFGISKFMLGLVDDVNRATADASEYTFAKNLTVPRLDRFKGAINNDLLPMFGNTAMSIEFDYDSPVPNDEVQDATIIAQKATAAKTLVDAGYDADDVLETVGLPPMKFKKPEQPPALPGMAPPDGNAPQGEDNSDADEEVAA
jgi:HK97 family phage portal protein